MNPPIRILVLQRGWVVVGAVSQQGNQVEVTNASVVRRWGTSRGLGELAAKGPLSDTVLDPAGTVRVHEQSLQDRQPAHRKREPEVVTLRRQVDQQQAVAGGRGCFLTDDQRYSILGRIADARQILEPIEQRGSIYNEYRQVLDWLSDCERILERKAVSV